MNGMHVRQQVMVDFCCRRWGLLKGANALKTWLVPSEKSPPYVKSPLAPDKLAAAVPKGRPCVISGKHRRVSLLTAPEMAHAQSLHLADFLGTDWAAYDKLIATSSHIELCNLIGNAFQTGSAGNFKVANLLLSRHKQFCQDEREADYAVRWAD